MTVQFNIEYKAMFGEQIVVNIQTEEGGLKLPLETTDGERWACDWCVESPEKSYNNRYTILMVKDGHATGVLNHQKNRIPIIIV